MASFEHGDCFAFAICTSDSSVQAASVSAYSVRAWPR